METKKHLIFVLLAILLFVGTVLGVIAHQCDILIWINNQPERMLVVAIGSVLIAGLVVALLSGFSCGRRCGCKNNLSVYSDWRDRHNCKCGNCKKDKEHAE